MTNIFNWPHTAEVVTYSFHLADCHVVAVTYSFHLADCHVLISASRDAFLRTEGGVKNLLAIMDSRYCEK